jgi:hypothetical protein
MRHPQVEELEPRHLLNGMAAPARPLPPPAATPGAHAPVRPGAPPPPALQDRPAAAAVGNGPTQPGFFQAAEVRAPQPAPANASPQSGAAPPSPAPTPAGGPELPGPPAAVARPTLPVAASLPFLPPTASLVAAPVVGTGWLHASAAAWSLLGATAEKEGLAPLLAGLLPLPQGQATPLTPAAEAPAADETPQPAPPPAGVLTALPSLSLSALEQGLHRFLGLLDRIGEVPGGVRAGSGLWPWIIAGAGAGAAALAGEIARRQLRRSPGVVLGDVDRLPGSPFDPLSLE